MMNPAWKRTCRGQEGPRAWPSAWVPGRGRHPYPRPELGTQQKGSVELPTGGFLRCFTSFSPPEAAGNRLRQVRRHPIGSTTCSWTSPSGQSAHRGELSILLSLAAQAHLGPKGLPSSSAWKAELLLGTWHTAASLFHSILLVPSRWQSSGQGHTCGQLH